MRQPDKERDMELQELKKNSIISDEAMEMIERQGIEKDIIIYDDVADYVESYDISSFRMSTGSEKKEMQSFQLSEGQDVGCEWQPNATIERNGKIYCWLNSGEDEISFLEESEFYSDLYIVYESENENEYGYFDYVPVNIYPILSEEEAEKLMNK